MTVSIIGYGRFGRLAARLIAPHGDVVVYDPRLAGKRRCGNGIRAVALVEAARQDIVLLAMPVSALESVLKSIVPHLQPGALVADVCAVKSVPCALLKKYVPKGVLAIGAHPLFGPDSVGDSLRRLHLVLCPVQKDGKALRLCRRLLRPSGLNVQVMKPMEHDKMMAETVFLTQCVGRWLAGARMASRDDGTIHYRRLRTIADVARNDSASLFEDMWRFNSFAFPVVRRLGVAWRTIERTILAPKSKRQ